MTLFYLGTFVGSVLLSFALTKYVRDVATVHGWVAAPPLIDTCIAVPCRDSAG